VYLVGFSIEIYYDARSYKHQNRAYVDTVLFLTKNILYYPKVSHSVLATSLTLQYQIHTIYTITLTF